MRQPLFSVGEKVICQLKFYPEYSGEFYITEILSEEHFKQEFPMFRTTAQYYYRLDGLSIIGPKTGHETDCAGESALRKIYKPSRFSFDQLISEIKCPRSITQ